MNLDLKYDYIDSSGNILISSLADLLKKSEKTILYFYPKDNTPGCSIEAKDFTCLKGEFQKLGIQIIGISKDNIESHKKFKNDLSLGLDLISDPNLILHKELGVYGEKNNYGKIVMGVIRSTFLFDNKGNLIKEWRNVKATGHAQKILAELQK
nr:peroxiredoxin [Candidatus Gracilibacteria bacterium]